MIGRKKTYKCKCCITEKDKPLDNYGNCEQCASVLKKNKKINTDTEEYHKYHAEKSYRAQNYADTLLLVNNAYNAVMTLSPIAEANYLNELLDRANLLYSAIYKEFKVDEYDNTKEVVLEFISDKVSGELKRNMNEL